ncbi:RND family efflux transporter MFP subunit [Pseudomonas duriflava]|uniref:RND family efflux transporter MFP subunit n=1 Tax=Pseudomonas duriflava TaxID=459528 RepID=A0A562QKW3_9PSED|nr:efflux RND transporter periplasmic adaptor subunit [Pseudomonas duriflava]TWI57364.1 RND family efflux transporter MFP subunit [Pseudomonas duriflava]
MTYQGWILVLVLLLTGCSKEDEAAPPPVRPVLWVMVKPESTQALGTFTGSIQARYESTLSFRVGGRIAQRMADVGDLVAQGALLAALDPTDQQNALRSREGDLARAQAQWREAQANAQRQQMLFAKGVGSQSQLDQVMAQLHLAQAALDQAEAAARAARDQLSYSQLHTEFEGIITAWQAEVGQVVAAGQAVVRIARPDIREAMVDLPAGLAEHIPARATFTVTSQLDPGVSATGMLRELAPQADALTRTRRARLTLNDPPAVFRLGSLVSVSLTADTPQQRSELPSSALFERDGKSQVWIIDPASQTVSLREVQVLARGEGRVTIGEGLQAGERVVTAGVHSLTPGQNVKMDAGQRQ